MLTAARCLDNAILYTILYVDQLIFTDASRKYSSINSQFSELFDWELFVLVYCYYKKVGVDLFSVKRSNINFKNY